MYLSVSLAQLTFKSVRVCNTAGDRVDAHLELLVFWVPVFAEILCPPLLLTFLPPSQTPPQTPSSQVPLLSQTFLFLSSGAPPLASHMRVLDSSPS